MGKKKTVEKKPKRFNFGNHRMILLQITLVVFIFFLFFQIQNIDVAGIKKTITPTPIIPASTASPMPSASPTITPTNTPTPFPTSTPKPQEKTSKSNPTNTPTPIVIQVQNAQHYGCTENGACVLMQGSGSSECSKDYHCKHYTCVNNSCALVPGKGTDSCGDIGNVGFSNDDWNTVFSRSCAHLACVDKACKIVSGVGADECKGNSDCQ